MRITSSFGMIGLSIFLILTGLSAFITGVTIPPVVMSVLAIASGVLLLIGK